MAPKNVEDIFPLTPMQRLMLVHSLAHPESSTLTNQVRYEIEGNLDVSRFRAAWDALVRRHPALRTAVLWEGLDRPLNVVRTAVATPFEEIDASGASEVEQNRIVASLAERDASGFDLPRAPLMRCTLVRRGPARHAFVWSVHHLVVDRWSYGVLIRDLEAFYEAAEGGRTPDLPPPGRFRDYVAWLERRPAGGSERFWRDHLAGVRQPTLWEPGGHARHGAVRGRAVRIVESADAALLEARASEWRTTPATVALASVGLMLAERNESLDVVTGLTVSGRPAAVQGVEEAVGSFVNNVPLRFSLRHDRPLGQWMRDIQAVQVRRQAHEHQSLDVIEEWSDLPSGESLFDGLVVLNLLPPDNEAWSGIRLRPVGATLDARYPWVLQVAKAGDGLELTLIHDADSEDAPAILDELTGSLLRLVTAPVDGTLGSVLRLAETDDHPPAPAGSVDEPPRRWADDLPFIEQEVLGAWREVLDQPDLGLDDDFFEAGGTSLQAARIFRRVERITGRVLSLSILLEASTPRTLFEALELPSDPAGPLVPILPGGEGRPMVAVPGIGGNVVGLYALAKELSRARPLFGLQSRGLDGRAEPLDTIEAIASDFAEAALEVGGGGVHLMGACWGAVVAFELARQLEARGVTVASLSLVDPAPLLRAEPGGRGDGERPPVARAFVADRLRSYWADFREGDWRSRLRLVRDKAGLAMRLVRSGGRTEESESEMHAMQVKAANTVAVERYRPTPVRAPARLYFSDGTWMGEEDPRLEWLDLLDPRPEVVTTPGLDSGDAIQTHAGDFAVELERWLSSVDPPAP
jgi:thioesterase domain-containing protein